MNILTLGIIFSIVLRLHKKAGMDALVVLHLEVQQKSCSSEHRDQESHSKAYFRNQYVCRSVLIPKDRAELYDSFWDPWVLQGCFFPVALPGPVSAPCPLSIPVLLQFVLICWVFPRTWCLSPPCSLADMSCRPQSTCWALSRDRPHLPKLAASGATGCLELASHPAVMLKPT